MMLERRLEQEDKLRDDKHMDSESEISVVDLVSSADEEAVVDVLVSTMMKNSAKRVSG